MEQSIGYVLSEGGHDGDTTFDKWRPSLAQ